MGFQRKLPSLWVLPGRRRRGTDSYSDGSAQQRRSKTDSRGWRRRCVMNLGGTPLYLDDSAQQRRSKTKVRIHS